MLFATNGKVQDLPADTQFEFWDSQSEFGRAYKIGKLMLQERLGPAGAYNHDYLIHLILIEARTEPYRVFVSRPVGQPVDWQEWARFCYWFFGFDFWQQEQVYRDMSQGNIGVWFGSFLAARDQRRFYGPFYIMDCLKDDASVDATQVWDCHEFEGADCASKRKVPTEYLTPEEVQEKWGWLISLLQDENKAKQLWGGSMTAADHAAEIKKGKVPPLDEGVIEPDATGETSLLPWLLLAGLGGLGLYLVVSK